MPTRTIDGRRVAVSRLDKVLYPATANGPAVTKGEVIDYYEAIAPAMLPHVVDRPVTRKRWPNGVDEPSFFEKNLAASAPDWLTRHAVHHKDRAVRYPVIDSAAALVWIGQQAALEVHVPQWRFVDGEPGPATRLVFDLDPGDGVGLAECARVAAAVRDLVASLGWTAYPVTSGSKGIHVYVPLDRTLAPGGASTVARKVATSLEQLHPDLVTATMAKSVRAGRVFVDWSQNNAAKTTIAPYSLRGRAAPTVAAPRTWDELEDPGLRHLRFDEVLDRFQRDGDLIADLDPRMDALTEYRRKRDADRTPEPIPQTAAEGGEGNSFVIQEHHARRLHYDFRLERDGVMVSWAVPRGLPTSSKENRLAVHTEDHPLEYASFAGSIPKGEYGGGTVSIWDAGTYEPEKWRDDEVIVRLSGQRAQGRYALIRTEGDQWLMHLMKDDGGAADLPRGLAPMLATAGTLDGLEPEQWAFEGKWDGIRLIVEFDGTTVRLRGRAGNDVTERYPALQALAAALDGHRVVLDGEVVSLDSHGNTSFPALQAGGVPQFRAFDILYLDGVSLLRKRYDDRRRILDALAAATVGLDVPPQLTGGVADVRAQSKDLEGVVAKRRDSIYLPGRRGTAWIKTKNWLTQEVVIGGWRRGRGAREAGIGSLLLGVPDKAGLRYVGRVGTGFSERERERLIELLGPLERESSPFAGEVPDVDRDTVWVTPSVVGEVRYRERTDAGRLRHPAWRGLRDDKSPDDVRIE
ncbi:ATP-dependent DNA ligase [Prescottella equi]|uniref:DNA ligase (ATP) n=1 Tax=Rhodococcus hoagii TaxID=43767 RepID=A0AAE5MKM1_RHOHA|nr:ATP-dependent DNA ligase [Prescottella equi]ERN46889.1 ATP-dependent DNA ligase [Prescottella equi NBRC 101255 = C 7]MBM4625426.1 ATP-dependent DNA ligase [Prescottella equi]ORL28120.1 ATP-dependent DNA ligase [Prescottella equi]ORM04358.1 ATP-dependent DNA ligase [Prescottella equi]ORM31067.1 ATP-dependent DNA ligase [Prescottella equi]